MNTVDLRRAPRKGMACAAVAAFACLGTLPANAEVANPNLVPAQSAYIISVPNSASLWSAWEANGLYGAYNKIMAMPEVQEKTADVRHQLSIIESSLGFKLDGPTLSKVFSSADIYILAEDAKKMDGVAILKVADADKAAKLMDLAEKAAAKSAESDDSDDKTSDTAAKDKATSAITTTDYQGVQIKSFKNDAGATTFVYARTGDFLLMSGNEATLKKAIDRAKATTPATDSVAASEPLKKVDAALASEKGEVYVYGNQELAWKINSSSEVPAGLRGPLQSFLENMAPVSFFGSSVKISPKEIYSYYYGTLKPGSENSLAVKNPGDKPLQIASYIPENTIWGVATSLLDAKSISDIISGVAGESEQGEKMADQMKTAEAGLGFSVKNDLVPSLSNEIGFSLSNVEMGGLIPSVDATIIFGLKDKAKMSKVTEGTERLVTNMMAAKSGDSETSAPAFKSEQAEGQTIKYVEIQGLANLSPGYVLTDSYLIIGSSKAALSGALKANKDGKNLASGAALTKLGHNISGNANVIQFLDISKIMDIAKQVTKMIPAAKDAGKYIDAANVIDVSGASTRIENGAMVSRSVMKLK